MESEVKYWLVRIGPGGREAERAWEKGVVGVWHGDYSLAEFRRALESESPLNYLNSVHQRNADKWHLSEASVRTVKTFIDEIGERDWVFMYSRNRIYATRLSEQSASDDENWLGLNTEDDSGRDRFKYRTILDKRCFEVGRLPDPFRLLQMVGQATVQEIRSARGLARILSECRDEGEVLERFYRMPLREWLDSMHPSNWESLCEAWLIVTKRFVPTGLLVGKTLPMLDIAGKRFDTGARIVAQCKKDPGRGRMEKKFIEYVRDARLRGDNALEIYYFAYGGIDLRPGEQELGIQLWDRDSMMRWLSEDGEGKRYCQILREWA